MVKSQRPLFQIYTTVCKTYWYFKWVVALVSKWTHSALVKVQINRGHTQYINIFTVHVNYAWHWRIFQSHLGGLGGTCQCSAERVERGVGRCDPPGTVVEYPLSFRCCSVWLLSHSSLTVSMCVCLSACCNTQHHPRTQQLQQWPSPPLPASACLRLVT